MKKIIALVLAACMLFGLAACGGGGSIQINNAGNNVPANNSANTTPANNSANTVPANNTDNTPAVPLTRGVVTKEGYTNEYFNVSFKLPAGWTIYDDDKLKSNYGYTDDDLGSKFKEAVEGRQAMIVYVAIDPKTGGNVIIGVNKTAGISAYTDQLIAEAMLNSFEKRSEEKVRNQITTVRFMGKDMPVVDYAYKQSGKANHISQIWLRSSEDYAMILNFTTTGEEMPLDLLGAFSTLK